MDYKEKALKMYDYCSNYLDRLNEKQVAALWEYFKMINEHIKIDMLSKEQGRVACLHFLVALKVNSIERDWMLIWHDFIEIWTAMLAMILVQKEYNRAKKSNHYHPSV